MIYKLQNGWTIPLGGDYLEYLQNIPETYGGSIQPSIKVESLPKKFNGSQKAARTYAEGYQKGAKPVTKAIDNAGQKIFNTTKNIAMFVPGPTGAITWLGQMGADTANGEYGKVVRDVGAAALMGIGLKGIQAGAKAIGRNLAGRGINIPWLDAYDYSALRGQYLDRTTNKVSRNTNIKPNSILNSTIEHLYTEYPELSSIGPKEAYRQYYETIFPASKVQTPYVHGTKSNLSGGLEASIKVPNAAAPETIGRNDFYLNLQPEASLQYADGIGVPEGFTWNKHRFWPLKEILGKPYKSDVWMSKPIKLREQVPNRAGQFSRIKNADGTYSGHGKLLEEYKAELGMQDLSNEEFLQRFGVQNEESFNQWVAKNRQMFSNIYDSGNYHGLYHVKIDANKPLTINGGNTYYSERGIWNRMNKGGNDVLLHNNAANEFGSDVAVVRDVTPQKVRILGSKPDQQGFADFMGGKQQFFAEIPTSPQEAPKVFQLEPQRVFNSKGAFTGYDPDMYTEKPMQAIKDFKFGRQEAWNYLGSKRKQKLDAHNEALLKRIVESDVQLSSEPFLIERNPQLRSMTPMQKPATVMQRNPDATWIGNNDDGFFLFHPKGSTEGETHIVESFPASSDQMYLSTRTSLDDSAFHEYLHRGKVGDAKGLAGWLYQWKMKHLMKPQNDIDPHWREYAQKPQEAVNFIEIGRKAGITNTPYPGPGPAKIIIKHIIDNDTLKGGFLNSTKWETKPKRVWDALQGKYIGLIPIGLGTTLMLNENE